MPPQPAATGPANPAPRLRYLHPLLVGALPHWQEELAATAALGFDTVLIAPPFAAGASGNLFHTADFSRPHPVFETGLDADALVAQLAATAKAQGLQLCLDLVLDRVAADGGHAAAHAGRYAAPDQAALLDPRRPAPEHGVVQARWSEEMPGQALVAWWQQRLQAWHQAGVAGFRCDAPWRVPPAAWRQLTAALPQARFMAWTQGAPAEAIPPLADCGFAAVFDSLAWWDLRQGWMAEEAQRLQAVAPAIATVESPFGPRLAAAHTDPVLADRAARRHLALAAGIGAGMLLPMGFEYGAREAMNPARDRRGDWEWLRRHPRADLQDAIRAANATLAKRNLALAELRPLTGPDAPVAALLRAAAPDARRAEAACLVLANPDLRGGSSVPAAALLPNMAGSFGGFGAVAPGAVLALGPGEVAVFAADAPRPIRQPPGKQKRAEFSAAAAPRIGIESVTPAVDGGRFAAKRSLGELVQVEADLICDGHDQVSAVVQWRAVDDAAWQEAPMRLLGNDRWSAGFPLRRLGRHVFRVLAWRDAFLTFREELEKKHAANVPIALELEEGRLLVEAAAERAGGALQQRAARLRAAGDAESLAILLAPETQALMQVADDRPFATASGEHPIEAERTAAGFASWYELFPRSQSGDEQRHGSFADVIARLPQIRAMGFDVLYFPPIHPIGRRNRKGRNNSLTPSPDDPGSPYAIGSAEGGHDALHPQLGTLEDFHALRDAAALHGMELAIDFAIQCSPDHPWLQQHKDWFAWRPDGSLRYAENPPKKYEDIVNVDFYAPAAIPGLWLALRDVVLFWAEQGVRCFRVDNPHTKPLPFWEWMIGEVKAQYPDAIFLSEAFTRPKVMYRLAKIGFSQSYTYFTWRNTKQELTQYLQELTTTAPRDFFRPHFFVNTPDINPRFLQQGGRPAHLIRAALAATLSGLWGVYQGFELCDARGLPGREEYLDSDKYQIRAWPARAPGDIVDEIARLNAIRRANPALHSHAGIAFHNAFNDQVLWYRKQNADRSNVLLIAVSLDPQRVQDAVVELPLWEWGLPDHGALLAEDLMRGDRFTWQGKHQQLRLDPNGLPFGIWRLRPEGAPA